MIREEFFKDIINTMTKEEIGSLVFWMESPVVITVIATAEDQEVWSEAELGAKAVPEWLNQLAEVCTLKFVHVSANGVNKIWKVE